MELNPRISITDTLKQVQDQKLNVEVYLRGGQLFQGKILDMAENYIVIGHLLGKDFFDALIRLDDISAISLKTRDK